MVFANHLQKALWGKERSKLMQNATSPRGNLRTHLKFERSEIPALLGILSVVAFLHIAGWGLFIYFNSDPKYH